MKKKEILMISLILILILAICFITYNQFYNSKINVGHATFVMPDGYYEGASTSDYEKNITNGFNSIIIYEYNNTNDITKEVNNYVDDRSKYNYDVTIKTFMLKGNKVYKSTIKNDTNNVHYWFNHDNKLYTLYTRDANKNIDSLASEIITSCS